MSPRGRPRKFGRQSQLVPLTLPTDVVGHLREQGADIGWAIVRLVEESRGQQGTEAGTQDIPDIELVPIGRDRFLIVVREDAFAGLDGASLVPLGAGRAFLAFAPGRTLDVLELSTLDALERPGLAGPARDKLQLLRDQLKSWRQDPSLNFHELSIVVGERRSRLRQRS